ncbi:MAG: hypothetical protein K2H53_01195 [Clostridia bacterium]|nr:hypothetical protein [Clostridia bacterium]
MDAWKENVDKIIKKLIADNEANATEDGGYAQGYYEGVHDAFVDVLNQLGIPTDEDFYN